MLFTSSDSFSSLHQALHGCHGNLGFLNMMTIYCDEYMPSSHINYVFPLMHTHVMLVTKVTDKGRKHSGGWPFLTPRQTP